MKRAIIASVVIASAIAAAQAQEFATAKVPSPSADLVSALVKVCAPGAFSLSERARVACDTQTFPRLVVNGSRFLSSGIGSELNTLVRQVQ